jgi:hypothetical protein
VLVAHAGIWGATGKAAIQRVASPAMPIARFRHVAIPQFMWVTTFPLRGVNGPAALRYSEVGATWGSNEHGGLNITE